MKHNLPIRYCSILKIIERELFDFLTSNNIIEKNWTTENHHDYLEPLVKCIESAEIQSLVVKVL